ncbi:MAG: response regulator transcription factor [Scytonematopsis contorta HA4267-MV1]|jgi:DNA-binding NarL/FixJ family response regulator|nr:response regulator transcription factor [Scytonematopsis contorta HA4267-MV1]
MSSINVVLVEDHDVVRIGLRTALQKQGEIFITGEASNGTQGLKLLQTLQPDIAIVDIGLPGMDGIEMTRQFRQFQVETNSYTTRVLIITMQGDENAVLAAFAAGADSYCMKNIGVERLTEAIYATNEGSSWIDPTIANMVLRQLRSQSPEQDTVNGNDYKMVKIGGVDPDLEQLLETYPLTEREREVLELIVSGCSNLAIAERLYITVGTVKTHVRNILNKLCANDRTQAAVRALRSGLIR